MPCFHLAFPVSELSATRAFYADFLGCAVGRESEQWIDFDFHGHQITAHLDPLMQSRTSNNLVDGKHVPVRHFGVILEWTDWQQLAERFRQAAVDFVIEPCIRFEGEPGEQATMFIVDPSGNHLEFKSFRDLNLVFAR